MITVHSEFQSEFHSGILYQKGWSSFTVELAHRKVLLGELEEAPWKAALEGVRSSWAVYTGDSGRDGGINGVARLPTFFAEQTR